MADARKDITTRDVTRAVTWKATTPGMWAWVAQRVAAVALLPLIGAHLFYPYSVAMQVMLVTAVVFHGMLGVRVMLLDLGVGARYEKLLLALVLLGGVTLLLLLLRHLT